MKAAEVQAGPELDALIAEKVMELHVDTEPAGFGPGEMKVWRNKQGYKESEGGPPRYSTDDAAAGKVVRRMRENWFSYKAWEPALVGSPEIYSSVSFVCGAGPCPKHGTNFHNHHGSYRVQAPTLALAICRSALVALNLAEEDAEF